MCWGSNGNHSSLIANVASSFLKLFSLEVLPCGLIHNFSHIQIVSTETKRFVKEGLPTTTTTTTPTEEYSRAHNLATYIMVL